ncbi:MAG: hypothetical protein ACOY5F_19350 [Pseudomonadota bacterium]
MAKVRVELTNHELSREENGVRFEVTATSGERRGQLIVSRGGLRWKPKSKQDHHKITWRQFDEVMRNYPRR